MKMIKSHLSAVIAAAAMAFAGVASSSCQDHFDDYTAEAPVATMKANTTILELKNKYWQDDANYAVQVGTKEDGSRTIISGVVVSSDEAGNVFKSITIQDKTAAISFSINSYNLYLNYRRGQEIVIDLTDLYIGKYAGLMQIGMKEWTDKVTPPSYQVSFMAPEMFIRNLELNGYPDRARIDTVEISSFSQLGASPADQMKFQCQLVKLNNVSFQNGGVEKFSAYHENVNQNIVDADGQTLLMRTSGYSNFWNKTLPAGKLDVVGILGYFNSAYQFTIIDYAGCMNIGHPTVAPGTETNPYSTEQVVSLVNNNTPASGWMTGYIVGTVAAEVTEVKSNTDIEWTSTPELDNSIVIGPAADTKDWTKCVVVPVTSGTALQLYGTLALNPANLGKQIWLTGDFSRLMGMAGVVTTGAETTFRIDGVEIKPPAELKSIYTESFASDMGKFTTENVVMPPQITYVWSVDTRYSCVKASGMVSSVKYATESYLVSPEFDLTGAKRAEVTFEHCHKYFTDPRTEATLWVSVDKGAWQQVAINTYGDNSQFSFVTNTTNLNAFAGKKIRIGFRYTSTEQVAGMWEMKNFDMKADGGSVSGGGGGGTVDTTSGDFNTFNDGQTVHMSYGSFTNKTGWKANNCLILSGSDTSGENTAPKFSFIGPASTIAVCLNGRADKIGTITSPTLTGGIKSLTFNYGIPYNDPSIRLTVKVTQGGKVVKEQLVDNTAPVKFTKYTANIDVNISGDFTIEIIDSPTTPKEGANGFRVAVWDLNWTR